MFHDAVELTEKVESIMGRAGDFQVALDQAAARYAVETLEPMAHDSFFRWGFFNAVLEKKERFSNYVFEDTAMEMLAREPELHTAFEQWKTRYPDRLSDQDAVLGFLFAQGRRHHEPQWLRYPVVAID